MALSKGDRLDPLQRLRREQVVSVILACVLAALVILVYVATGTNEVVQP